MPVDNRVYFVVENSDRSLQNQLMTVVAVISSIVNFLLFYLILKHSKKEKMISKVVNLLHNLLLYLSQLHWGSLFGLVFLLPFPALYSIGVLSSILSTFWLVTIWVFLFCLFTVLMFLVILVRLRTIARPKRVFDWKPLTYALFIFFIVLITYIPIPYAWFSSYRSEEQMREHVLNNYPNCRKALDIPGIFIYLDISLLNGVIIAGVTVLIIGAITYILLCSAIIYELKQQSNSMSVKHLKYHRKLLKDTIVQNLFRAAFLLTPPIVLFKNAYVPPEDDTIIPTILANVAFASAPIPGTLLTFVQIENYRLFLKGKVLFWRQKDANPSNNSRIFERGSVVVKRGVPAIH